MNHDALPQVPPGQLMAAPARSSRSVNTLSVLGVPVADVAMNDALGSLEQMLQQQDKSRAVFFVNTHTLNLACDDPGFRDVLRGADRVYGDGTGVRWAVRLLHRRALRDNINGTDIVPLLFSLTAGRGLRYFLLGNMPGRIERAAEYASVAFPGWTLAGYHHGYLNDGDQDDVIKQINASGAHMLLVGMGNPKQEQWIARYLPQLRVPLCMGTGGLFDYWVGDLVRAPAWIRRIGYEWLHLLIKQPHKAGRYLVGNPRFLFRALRNRVLRRDVEVVP